MVAPLLSREKLTAAGFFASDLACRLASVPIGVIDVGARWGVHDIFRPVGELLSMVAFEADPEEADRLRRQESGDTWASFEICADALGAAAGEVDLHILAKPNNSSIYRVNRAYAERYKLHGFELVKKVRVPVTTLDQAVFDARVGAPQAGEVLKLDVQGAEFDTISGATRLLRERTACVICEVAFFPAYDGMKLFSEIELALRAAGFSFYGLLDFQHRSTKRLDKRTTLGRERTMQGDAVFLRDPFEQPGGLSATPPRQIDTVLLMALLLGYFDFCLEVVDALSLADEERRRLSEIVVACATVDPHQSVREISALHKLVQRSGGVAANVEIGRLVDRWRDYHSFHDVPD